MAVASLSPMPSRSGLTARICCRSSQRLRASTRWSIAAPRRNLKPCWRSGAPGHQNVQSGNRAAHEVVALDRRARRSTADRAAARQHGVKGRAGLCAGIGVHQVPLPAAVEPHRTGLRQRRCEVIGVGQPRIGGVQHVHVPEPELAPGLQHHVGVVACGLTLRVAVAACGWNDHGGGCWAASQLDEGLQQPGAFERTTADHQQRAVSRAVQTGPICRGCGGGCGYGCGCGRNLQGRGRPD